MRQWKAYLPDGTYIGYVSCSNVETEIEALSRALALYGHKVGYVRAA